MLGSSSRDPMRNPRNRASLALPVRGTVYLISCIFMIKFITLKGQRAKVGTWVGGEKRISEY